MSKTVSVKTSIPITGGKVISNFDLVVTDETVTQIFEVVYVSPSDGGPLMRPKNPPM